MRLLTLLVSALLFASCASDDREPALTCPSDEQVQMSAPTLNIDFMMDRYEASRVDATSSFEGEGVTLACSVGGVIPWTSISYSEAHAACEASGKRLCTRDEWLLACQAFRNWPFPYGPDYDASACNASDAGIGSTAPTGGSPDCVSTQGAYDLSGNVREWVSSGASSAIALGGGAFDDSQINTACEILVEPQDGPDGYLPGPGDGFRCCSDP